MKEIKVLGTGCPKCGKLKKNVEEALAGLEIEYSLEKVEDIQEIVSFGVMMTPALVVDGEVKFSGKVPGIEELRSILTS